MQDLHVADTMLFRDQHARSAVDVHVSFIEACLFFPDVGGIRKTVQQNNRRCSFLSVVGDHEVQPIRFEALSFTRHGAKAAPRSAYCDPCCTEHVVQCCCADWLHRNQLV